jgi:hypothetical protein
MGRDFYMDPPTKKAMKIRFYFAQTQEDETRREYIVRYNRHEGIVTTINADSAPSFDLADPGRRLAANNFQTIMQVMSLMQSALGDAQVAPSPVQFEFFEIEVDEPFVPHHSV